jgi:hypothetical protein
MYEGYHMPFIGTPPLEKRMKKMRAMDSALMSIKK